ncbi:MAG: transglycosylase SLT domain-containing protein [Actinophytocola sp.]|nr:transglycosylase SLT domain-containing protein [Actinophytocola sp.]
MLKAALVAGSVLGDLPREGLRIAAALAVLFLLPVLLVVIATAALVAMLLSGFPGFGGSDPPPVPPEHLGIMLEVSAETGVPWELLAAIASVESGFGANMATSSAGAIGYGQFLPPSWEAFGEGGDPYDYRDAIPAMARYLVAAGVATDVPNAVWAYNHSWEYVALVLGRASYYAAGGLVPTPTLEAPPALVPAGVPS